MFVVTYLLKICWDIAGSPPSLLNQGLHGINCRDCAERIDWSCVCTAPSADAKCSEFDSKCFSRMCIIEIYIVLNQGSQIAETPDKTMYVSSLQTLDVKVETNKQKWSEGVKNGEELFL